MSFIKTTLGDISLNIQTGPFGSQLHQSDYSDEGIPVVMPKDLFNGKIVEDSIARVSSEHVSRLLRHKIEKGDILYSRRGDVGRCAYASEHEQGWLCGTGCLRVTIDQQKADSKYIFFRLQLPKTIGWVVNHAVGSTMLNLNTSILSELPIELPSLEEQNRIANILSTYDNLIENNQKQIKLLEEAAQRLYKEWFVDLRFPGHENTEIIDGVPEGWQWESILENNIFNFVNSRVLPFDGTKKYFATADVSGTNIVSLGEKITFEGKPSRASIQPIEYSVWFARMSNSYKILNCFGENFWMAESAILSSGFAGFTSKEEYYGFVYETIASEYFDKQKNLYATGATQVSLTNEGLSKIKVLIPTIDVISRYSKLVEPFISKAELLKNKNVKLKEARDRLLPKLMSGELEV